MFIRDALINDLEGITDCARRFFKYAEFEKEYGLPFDSSSFKEMVANHIENGVVLLLMDGLYVAGGIAGMIHSWGFNREIKICQELFFWVDEKYRGANSVRLFHEYEKKVKDFGADKIIMISPNTYLQEQVNILYKRMGYKHLEQYWIKTV